MLKGLKGSIIALGFVGIGLLACWWNVSQLGDLRTRLTSFYVFFGIAFGLYLLALGLIARLEKLPRPESYSRFLIGWVLFAALGSRLLMAGTTPTLSDDIHRYRWDGLVQRAGIDPYRYAPNHPALDGLRDGQDRLINFPHLRTVYPPLAEFAFWAAFAVGPSLTDQKWPFLISEVLLLAALLALLRLRRRSPLWVTAYLWHPLPILEIAGSGHNDALGIALLWVGIVAWELRRYGPAAISWALAFLSKYAAILLVPWWWLRRVGRREFGLFLILSTLPFLAHPTALTAAAESFGAMSARSGSNGSVHSILAFVLGSSSFARLLCAAGGVVFLGWWARRETDVVRYLLGVLAVGAVLSPVLHPWYLTWVIPALCFWRPWPVVALTGTVVLAYTVWPGWLATGAWRIPFWARFLEYAPVGAFGLWEIWRCKWALSSRLVMRPARSVAS